MQQVSKTVTVVIVDASPLFGRGLMAVMEAGGSIQVVGQASNAKEALHMIAELRPDVVLAVARVPLLDCSQTVQSIRTTGFSGGIVVLNLSDTPDEHFNAIEAGTDVHVFNESEHEELHSIIMHASRDRDLILLNFLHG